MNVDLYLFPQSGNIRAVTKQWLEGYEVDAVKIEVVEGDEGVEFSKEVPTTTKLDAPDKVEAIFPGGQWHSVVFRDKVTGGDRERADALQWRKDPATGALMHLPYRYAKSWAIVLLKSWTLTDDDGVALPLSEQGYDQLSEDVVTILEAAVLNWKDQIHPNLTARLTIK